LYYYILTTSPSFKVENYLSFSLASLDKGEKCPQISFIEIQVGKAIPFSILFLAKTFLVSSLIKLSVDLVISIILTPGLTFSIANFKAAVKKKI
jgi:hypothetical protein